MTETFKLLTLNLRHDADRWTERRPLIARVLAHHAADVVAFQEVALRVQQADLLAADVAALPDAPTYTVHVQSKWGDQPWEGIALLSKHPVTEVDAIDLPEGGRVAQRIRVVKAGFAVDVVNTHLHHRPETDETIRLPQMQALRAWVARLSADGQDRRWLIAGDFNAQPASATVQHMVGQYPSAYAVLHGADPLTFPTALATGTAATTPEIAIDYIFFDPARLDVTSAELVGAQPAPGDDRLYPSDHLGIVAAFTPR